MKAVIIVAFDDSNITLDAQTAIEDGSGEPGMSETEAQTLLKSRERRNRISENSKIVQTMPLTGAQSHARIAGHSLDVLKELHLLPTRDPRRRIVERIARKAD